jgi:hypothetical protein
VGRLAKDINVGFSNIFAKAQGIGGKPAFPEAFQRLRRLVPIPRAHQSRCGPIGRCWLVKNAATSQVDWVDNGSAPASTPRGMLACTKALAVVRRLIPADEALVRQTQWWSKEDSNPRSRV